MPKRRMDEAGAEPTHNPSCPVSSLERDQVRAQLSRILASPPFQNSKRYAAVLRYIVEQTLEGGGDRLKERTIGIEVFNRTPDYDTGTDHAVRSAMTEVRKRLGQYYAQDREGIRIELQPGCYIPQFRCIEEPATAPGPLPLSPNEDRTGQAPADSAAGRKSLSWIWMVAAVVLAMAGAAVWWFSPAKKQDALTAFWNPILSSPAPTLLCIGNPQGWQAAEPVPGGFSPTLTLRQFHNLTASTVNEYDAFTLARFAGMLQAHGKTFRLASQSDATFTDLQNGPAVLIGLLNNDWTERLMPKLRFTVEQPTPDKVILRDRNNPSNQGWAVDYSIPYLKLTRDYALVLRMVDPKTEQPVVIDAGITVFGTSAAGEFLTNPSDMKKLAAIAPRGWEKKNMEIVLETDVIQGRSGPARILATQFW